MNNGRNQSIPPGSRSTAEGIADDVLARNARNISIMLIFAAVITIGLFVYIGQQTRSWQVLVVAAIMFVSSFGAVGALFLIRQHRSNLAMTIVITNFIITFLVIPFFIQGLGVILALTVFILTVSITGLTMPPRYAAPGLIAGLVSGSAILILDTFILDAGRVRVAELEQSTALIVIGFVIYFTFYASRHFNRFSLRIKIALSILLTGGVIVATLTWFAVDRAGSILTALTDRYEQASTSDVQNQLKGIIQTRANEADSFFAEILNDLLILADYRASLQQQNDVLSLGAYWNAESQLIQLPGGQYGNPGTDIASVFIPSVVPVDQTTFAELNTSAYLDFFAPNLLKSHPDVIAVYFISKAGVTTYYPNINLSQNLPADFNPTKEQFYEIAAPENNPSREPRWTSAYLDPAGNGLITTLSVPVYSNDTFLGVMGLDLQLEDIAQSLAEIKVGDSSYTFLVDKSGHILAMPPQGYLLYGYPSDGADASKRELSILAKGSFDVQEATAHMINGDSGVEAIKVGDSNFFFIFAPLPTPNYRFAIIVPEAQFTAGSVASRNEIEQKIQSALQRITLILVLLLIGAIVVSLWIGQVITRPLVRLTQTAETIAQGNFSARAIVEAQDETGILANSFNSMAARLNDTLLGLEKNVSDRTQELEKANASIVRRAGQFEAIARVARTISSTQSMDALLPLIADTISAEFGFYHTGIFLLDAHREYAVLTAANSEGGKRMLARHHRLLVGGTGIVGFVTNSGQPRVALDVGLDAAYFDNPDLPDTHSEIALPLRIGTQIIGALDVQSRETNAFSQEDVSILSTLADQVSIAIQNARSYQQSREALGQAEAASMQMSEQQWGRFFATQPVSGFVFDGIDARDIKQSRKTGANGLAIPLVLRGTRVGTLKLTATDPNRTWTEEELVMAQAAAERTALALENARLLQEAQKRAAKERTIGQITAKIGGLVNIENILKTSIQELGNTLPHTDIAIQLSPEKLEHK
jgi:GAF domain-containing protein/HAMP domain-containing protein